MYYLYINNNLNIFLQVGTFPIKKPNSGMENVNLHLYAS